MLAVGQCCPPGRLGGPIWEKSPLVGLPSCGSLSPWKQRVDKGSTPSLSRSFSLPFRPSASWGQYDLADRSTGSGIRWAWLRI